VPRLPARLPKLVTRRLVLRGFRPSDVDSLLAYRSDPELHRYTGADPTVRRSQARKAVAIFGPTRPKREVLVWAIVLKSTGQVIGQCGFHPVEPAHARANLGYEVAREHWGRGIATEAARRIVRHGHDVLRLNRITGYCWKEHAASARVMRKLGFKFEGTLRQFQYRKGVFHDCRFYSHLPADPRP
jgi:ribosomal-protein-alanine N-acetyltransferase